MNWYLRGPYAMTVGQPTRFEGDAADHEQVHYISETIMEEIRARVHKSERRVDGRNLAPSPI